MPSWGFLLLDVRAAGYFEVLMLVPFFHSSGRSRSRGGIVVGDGEA
jgi:hypothetical protein